MIVAICGPSGVGKSSVCGCLAARGFTTVSASGIARLMYETEFGRQPTNIELAEFGLTILSSQRESHFADLIERVLPTTGAIAIDGLRSKLAIKRLKIKYSAIIVFIRREKSKAYYKPIITESSQSDIMLAASRVDAMFTKDSSLIDIIVDNNQTLDETCDLILERTNAYVIK